MAVSPPMLTCFGPSPVQRFSWWWSLCCTLIVDSLDDLWKEMQHKWNHKNLVMESCSSVSFLSNSSRCVFSFLYLRDTEAHENDCGANIYSGWSNGAQVALIVLRYANGGAEAQALVWFVDMSLCDVFQTRMSRCLFFNYLLTDRRSSETKASTTYS